jgi:hypothetical protein
MDCGPGKFAVKAYAVKPSCRKAKGGILGQQLRTQIKLRQLKAKLDRAGAKAAKKKAKEDAKLKRKARAKGPSKKRVKMM